MRKTSKPIANQTVSKRSCGTEVLEIYNCFDAIDYFENKTQTKLEKTMSFLSRTQTTGQKKPAYTCTCTLKKWQQPGSHSCNSETSATLSHLAKTTRDLSEDVKSMKKVYIFILKGHVAYKCSLTATFPHVHYFYPPYAESDDYCGGNQLFAQESGVEC